MDKIPTREDWAEWKAHKSNKDIWIEEQEREEMLDLEIKNEREHE